MIKQRNRRMRMQANKNCGKNRSGRVNTKGMEGRIKKMDKNDKTFYGLVFLLVILMFFFSQVRAAGQEDIHADEDLYYQQLIKDYTQNLRGELAKRGCPNSGLTVSAVIDGQIRTYYIRIHHDRLSRMDETGRQAVLESLTELPPEADGVRLELSVL
ncbi:MAG: hypothetical protein IJ600_10225 [Lachnospiraceae bacterium]|nr:hypothetical protein [Lachnospiraceae bacterium]